MSTKTATYGDWVSAAYRKPPSTGPRIVAICHVTDERATTHGTRSGSTMSAGNARVGGSANACATPKQNANAKIGATVVGLLER